MMGNDAEQKRRIMVNSYSQTVLRSSIGRKMLPSRGGLAVPQHIEKTEPAQAEMLSQARSRDGGAEL